MNATDVVTQVRHRFSRLAGPLALACAFGLGVLPATHAATPPDTLVIGKSADPQTLDPAITIDNNDWTITYPAYQRLMRYAVKDGQGTTEVEGDLATEWKTSDDKLTWEFKLRDGQKFDDGTPVDAKAVKFSFDRLFKIKQGPSEAFPAGTKVDAVDDMTVRFTLPQPFAPFIYTLANNGASIVNPNVVSQKDAGEDGRGWLANQTAGSGPYRLTSWQKGQSLTLEPNPHYGGDAPALKRVVVRIVGEASARRLQLERGDLDIAEAIPEDQLKALEGKPGVKVAEYPSLQVTYLYMNNKRPPLDNPAVRQAISYAVDYDGIIDGILHGKARQMRGPIPEGLWGHDPEAKQFKTDLVRAKALLSEAKVSNAKLGFLYATRDPNWEPIGLSTQANLASLGINLTMENLANATMRDRLGKGEFDIAIGNWTPDFADPYMFMNYWFDSGRQGLPGNRSFYTNPKVDELVRAAALQTDQAERVRLYQEAQKLVMDDAAYVYLFQKNYPLAMRDDVKGYVFNPMLLNVFNVGTMSK